MHTPKALINPIVLMGPPGCGKGTVAERLRKEFSYAVLSSGLLIRGYIKENHDPLARRMDITMRAGENVSDEDLVTTLGGRLRELTTEGQRVVGDGLIRSYGQAKMFENFADELDIKILIFNINISLEEAKKRLATRYYAGKVSYSSEEEAKNFLKNGEIIERRGDDRPELIQVRFGQYLGNEMFIEAYCLNETKKLRLIQINGELNQEDVYQQVIDSITRFDEQMLKVSSDNCIPV